MTSMDRQSLQQLLSHVSRHPEVLEDLAAAGDGYSSHTSYCPDGVPLEFALLTLLAAFGAAFGVLYIALTMAGGGRGSSEGDASYGDSFLLLGSHLADLAWSGMI